MAYRSGLSRERARRRWRTTRNALLWLTLVAGLGAIGYASYLSGSELARQEVRSQQQEIRQLSGRLGAAQAENAQLSQAIAQSRQAAAALQRRYDADVPSGSLATLLALVAERLHAGVAEDRLAQVLREAEALRPCEVRAVRKRFLIQVAGQPPQPPVTLLDGLIGVTASLPAGAEDQAKSVIVTITRAWLAQPLTLTGMPLRQTIAVNNIALTLVVEPSDIRGYGAVSLSTCAGG